MIYIETNSTNPYFNLATELYIVTKKPELIEKNTVFMLWRTEPTLMVGKYQNVFEEIDVEYAKAQGIHILRRMSGGGTVFTDLGGYQYSFIRKSDNAEADKINFSEYMQLIKSALNNLGANACVTGRNDITLAGKKISGNAQYKQNGATVHHGTLLFSTDIEQMVRATTVDPNKIISKSIKSVRERVTNISEHLNYEIAPEEFKARVVNSIMGESYDSHELTQADISGINEIAHEFMSWEFVFGKSPKFSIINTGYFAGGKLTASLNVENGHISSLALTGDFFAVDLDSLINVLIGCKYEYEAVLERLQAHENAIYRISSEELAKAIMGVE